MITWPIFVAFILAVIAIYFKIKAENKALEHEKEEQKNNSIENSNSEEKNNE